MAGGFSEHGDLAVDGGVDVQHGLKDLALGVERLNGGASHIESRGERCIEIHGGTSCLCLVKVVYTTV